MQGVGVWGEWKTTIKLKKIEGGDPDQGGWGSMGKSRCITMQPMKQNGGGEGVRVQP